MEGAAARGKSVYIFHNQNVLTSTPWEKMENIWMENKFCVVTWWDSDGILQDT